MRLRFQRSEAASRGVRVWPRRAIIDIGSNTVRLVVYGGSPRAPITLFNEKVAARLGRDITSDGILAEEAVDLAMRGLRRFALLLAEHEVTDVEVVATAAVREAKNGAQFVAAIEELGLHPRVLTGVEEAAMAGWGVLGAFPGATGIGADLGGGSLELVPVANGEPLEGASLRAGTLRLAEMGRGEPEKLRKAVQQLLKKQAPAMPDGGTLYLVGGSWRALGVFAMEARDYPLTDPHGFGLSPAEAVALGKKVAGASPDALRHLPRISSMRSETMPDAGVLLQALVKRLEPARVIISAWGLREGLLFRGLDPFVRAQDPLLAGIAEFAGARGATPLVSARVASWTVGAIPATSGGGERLRLAATMLALAAMQIEPNLRMRQATEWALHKRWLAISPAGRAMIAAAIHGNGNECDLADEITGLASPAQLEEALCWGLALRLCRRIGALSARSLETSHLGVEGDTLVLRLERDHEAVFGIPQEKDMRLLADRLKLDWRMEVVDAIEETMRDPGHALLENVAVGVR